MASTSEVQMGTMACTTSSEIHLETMAPFSEIIGVSASEEFIWKIDHFSRMNAHEGLCCGVFCLGSSKWDIQIYPKGNGEVYDQLSVYLQSRGGLTEPVQTDFNLGIMNQLDSNKTVWREMSHQFYGRADEGYGWSDLISLSEFHQATNKFLVNDTCVMEGKLTCKFKDSVDDGSVKESEPYKVTKDISSTKDEKIKDEKTMAFRMSNNLVGIFNFITFLLSIPILGVGIWLNQGDCEKFLDESIIALGVLLMIVSLAGFIGASCRVSWLLLVYLVVMILLIVVLLSFTIFAFVVTNKGAGEVAIGRGYKEYRLNNYSNWLQKRVGSPKNWNGIKSCLQNKKVCKTLSEGTNVNATQFFLKHLSPIQSGCCKPPQECGFQYKSATVWDDTGNITSANLDCGTWKSAPSTALCFDCRSCKAGVLANLKNDWKKVAILNIIFLIFLFIVYSVGCCAIRNNREDYAYHRWKGNA